MKALYAQALTRLLGKGVSEEALVKNLVLHLRSRGRMKLLPGILRELNILKERSKVTGAKLEVAREEDTASAKAAASKEGIDATEVTINPSLLSGWRARSRGVLLDRSGKRSLVDLYSRIVSS